MIPKSGGVVNIKAGYLQNSLLFFVKRVYSLVYSVKIIEALVAVLCARKNCIGNRAGVHVLSVRVDIIRRARG